jgi:hypothetical protein
MISPEERGRKTSLAAGHVPAIALACGTTNTYLLSAFRYHTSIILFRSLRRHSQRHRLTWERMIRHDMQQLSDIIGIFFKTVCVCVSGTVKVGARRHNYH